MYVQARLVVPEPLVKIAKFEFRVMVHLAYDRAVASLTLGRMRTPVRKAFSYGIRHGIRHIHCDSMKYDLMLHWITMNMPYPVPYPVWKWLPYGSTHPPYSWVGKSSTFLSFSSNFDQFFLDFLKLNLFSSSFWPSGWASRPPGKALATPLANGQNAPSCDHLTRNPKFCIALVMYNYFHLFSYRIAKAFFYKMFYGLLKIVRIVIIAHMIAVVVIITVVPYSTLSSLSSS